MIQQTLLITTQHIAKTDTCHGNFVHSSICHTYGLC